MGCQEGTQEYHGLCIPDDRFAECDLTLRLVLTKAPSLYVGGKTQEGVEDIAVKSVFKSLREDATLMGVLYINGGEVTDRRIH